MKVNGFKITKKTYKAKNKEVIAYFDYITKIVIL